MLPRRRRTSHPGNPWSAPVVLPTGRRLPVRGGARNAAILEFAEWSTPANALEVSRSLREAELRRGHELVVGDREAGGLEEGTRDLDCVGGVAPHPEAQGGERQLDKTAEAAAWPMSNAPREVRTSNHASQQSSDPVI